MKLIHLNIKTNKLINNKIPIIITNPFSSEVTKLICRVPLIIFSQAFSYIFIYLPVSVLVR